jgi:hypothetical protein
MFQFSHSPILKNLLLINFNQDDIAFVSNQMNSMKIDQKIEINRPIHYYMLIKSWVYLHF